LKVDGFVKSPDAAFKLHPSLRQAQGRLSACHGEPVEPRAPCLRPFYEAAPLTTFKTFYGVAKVDELVKSRKSTPNVIPAKAGIQKYQMV
jgi:hypothetical protein